MANVRPLPQSNHAYIGTDGKPGKDFYNWLAAVQRVLNPTLFSWGTVSGTITPNPSAGIKQSLTNNGAFTFAATSEVGDCQVEVINGATAGAITFSGFTKNYAGDALDTTNGHKFVIFVYGFGADGADYMIKARQ